MKLALPLIARSGYDRLNLRLARIAEVVGSADEPTHAAGPDSGTNVAATNLPASVRPRATARTIARTTAAAGGTIRPRL